MSASGNGVTETTFRWFTDLQENNSAEWFHANRTTFDEYVAEPFEDLLEEVTARLAGTDAPLRGGAATTFRMNRDVRFSADKSPYSTSRSALLTRSGTKSESGGLVYVQLGGDGGLLAGGLYKPPTSRLDPLRQSMLEDPDGFSAVVDALAANGHELDRSDAVKTMPRGYTEHADHPLAAYLRLKQLVVMEPLPKAAWLDDTAADRVVDFALGIAPLLRFVDPVPARG
ncbi:TIGR02453 family protein [Aquipuribacter nitratireducens]|uniref:DUF2461 domain-containing protein n=1 Tax=Aquipuribacter nitratireducens TaxID=650104 RepID=A0ABW0GP06_9MICO